MFVINSGGTLTSIADLSVAEPKQLLMTVVAIATAFRRFVLFAYDVVCKTFR